MWIKDGDEAIDSLNSWLSKNAEDMEKMEPVAPSPLFDGEKFASFFWYGDEAHLPLQL
ncbi:MAG: hypothetical protein QW797_09565 [Thermoproteota archaeon]